MAYCVTSGEARSVVATALRLSGAEPLASTSPQLLVTLRHARPCAALIHDLHPWDASSVAQLEVIRSEHPDLPILLYAPVRAGVADLLLQCARLPCVRAELQQSLGGQETQRVRLVLRSLLDEGPAARLLRMLQTMAPDAPQRAWSFTQLALTHLRRCPGSERLTVARLACHLGMSERTLERAWDRSVLPPPKELLEWLALLLATLQAAASETSVARIARDWGIDAQRLYRLRLRLLPPSLRAARNAVFLAFATRCRGGRLGAISPTPPVHRLTVPTTAHAP